jgi:excisionase family DNA binding protein
LKDPKENERKGGTKVRKALDTQAVAEQLGVSKEFVRRHLVGAGLLRAYRIGRRLKFSQDDVDAFLRSRQVGVPTEAA